MKLVLLTDGLNGQAGGIQRVSRAVLNALEMDLTGAIIWSANDSVSLNQGKVLIRAFNGRYLRMCLTALFSWNCSITAIFCYHLALSPIAALLSWKYHCPFHLFLHGTESWREFSWPVRHSLKCVTSFASNSKYTYERFSIAHPTLAKPHFQLLPLGLNHEFIEWVDKKPSFDSSFKRYFLTVTRFEEEYKGLETLLRSFQYVRARNPDVGLVIVGEGTRRPQVEKFAESLNLAESVQFTGRVNDSDLVSLYRDCHSFVLLSQGEGFGIVFTEAMYFGKPCIVTNADASCELVRHEETGLVVPPQNTEETVEALCRIISDHELYQSMGRNAKKLVLENYMPSHFQKRLQMFMSS